MGRGTVRSAVETAAGAAMALGALMLAQVGAAPVGPRQGIYGSVASFVGAAGVSPGMRQLKADAPLTRLARAYGVKSLWDSGTDGTGATVAVLVSFGDKNIQSVIDNYDSRNGLPQANVQTIAPAGAVPACDKAADAAACEWWECETDLDVKMIHTMAPGAKIIVAATPVAETQGITGLPEMMKAVDYLTDNKLANVISMSFDTTEQNFDSGHSYEQIRTRLDPTLERASAAGITLVAASGDEGASGFALNGTTLYTKRVASWPATNPYVTAIGGTERVQDQPSTLLGQESGAGLSVVYGAPSWQSGVADTTGGKARSFPDLTMEGIRGTSESAPLFAGVLALAVQQKGGNLGQINPALYTDLGPNANTSGIVDVTKGNNNYNNVTGYRASKGFDIASGWGTLDAATFVPALVKAVG